MVYDTDDIEDRPLEFDEEFEIFSLMQENLYHTIAMSIEEENRKMTEAPPIPKELMLNNIVEFNLNKIEDGFFMTLAPDGKLHLCGSWLMRPFLVEMPDGSKRMIPTMFLIQEKFKALGKIDMLVFEPKKDGLEYRRDVWSDYPWKQLSFDLPQSVKLPDPTRNEMAAMLGMMKGPPGAGGPPPGWVPPNGMPPQGQPPMGMPPQGMPPMGRPPMGMPPQGIQAQNDFEDLKELEELGDIDEK